jgi:hypothetical protein
VVVIETRVTEFRIEDAEEERGSPFPKEWGDPPRDLEERFRWAKGHAARVLQRTVERRRIDPTLAIANLRRRLELSRRGPE